MTGDKIKEISIAISIVAVAFGAVLIVRKSFFSDPPMLGEQTGVIMLHDTITKPQETFDDQKTVQPSLPLPGEASGSSKNKKGPFAMEIDAKKQYTAILKTTAGNITIRLNAEKTPVTVNNFVVLARRNFYDKTIFHRVIKGFMIQGGDPKGNGTGGPGYTFEDEPFEGEYVRGTVAMANAGSNTNGSQFFIMHKDYPLPKNYVIFGHVTDGMNTVDTIAEAETKPGGEGSSPVTPVTVTSIDIIEE